MEVRAERLDGSIEPLSLIREFSAAEQAARFVNWTGELERAMRFAT
jgi:hypothetical protein